PGLTPALDTSVFSFCPYKAPGEKPEKELYETDYYETREPLPKAVPSHHRVTEEARAFLCCPHCSKRIYYY
ncbi:MAG: hypothetical protein FWE85_01490, partial [Clostridiales bacterium]|nr:hypothetical protein [Clostridiales bacterium]